MCFAQTKSRVFLVNPELLSRYPLPCSWSAQPLLPRPNADPSPQTLIFWQNPSAETVLPTLQSPVSSKLQCQQERAVRETTIRAYRLRPRSSSTSGSGVPPATKLQLACIAYRSCAAISTPVAATCNTLLQTLESQFKSIKMDI